MEKLQEIIDDYIERMEGINEKRLALSQRQLDYELAEMRAFNMLRQKLLELHGCKDGIPEDQFAVQAPGDVLQPDDWEERV